MANPEQLERLRQGFKEWNKRRREHAGEPVDVDNL